MWVRQASAFLLVCGTLFHAPGAARGLQRGAAGWVRVAPASEGFEAALPAAPAEAEERLRLAGKTAVVRYYGASADGTLCAVLSARAADFPDEVLAYVMMLNLINKQVAFAARGDDVAGGSAVQAEVRRPLRLNGYAGREYALRVRKSTGLLRFYSTGSSYYAAVALSAGGVDDPSVDRFFNSFKLAAPDTSAATGPAGVVAAGPAHSEAASAAPEAAGAWLVILKTYGPSERAAAGRDLELFRRAGHAEARLVRTEEYPNLRKGLLAIVMGPYPKAAARGALAGARSVARGAYIKSGW